MTSNFECDDLVWRDAWAWVMREHERALDDDGRLAMQAWLGERPAHRQAYEQASRLWLLAGLVPPAQIDLPGE
ncbi:MAG: DUF4880 domain-containing protein [Aquabacterium sp.]